MCRSVFELRTITTSQVTKRSSRPAKGEKAEQFWGVEEDVESIGEFIRLFLAQTGRTESPVFPLRMIPCPASTRRFRPTRSLDP